MTEESIIKQIEEGNHRKIKFAITDIDGVLRGKMIHKEKFLKGVDHGLGFCDVIFGWDVNDLCYENSIKTGWHSGYPDDFARIDIQTYRTIPWDDQTPFFLADFSNARMADICPRSLLKSLEKECIDLGFYPFFSGELEWFNFKENPVGLAEKQYHNPTPLTPGMFGYSLLRLSLNQPYFNDLFNLLDEFRIPIEGLHTETGHGVMEGSILKANILEAADRMQLFKTGVKEIAYRHHILASFMAKWNAELPGCSGHVHQSLWDLEKKQNLFYEEGEPHNMSILMKQFLAGQLFCLPHIMPLLAPTVNSYKRLAGGDWAPATVAWGIENRTTAFRVVNQRPHAMRIEGRISGSDVNPYLAMAAYLASGLYGIKNKLSLDMPPFKGNAYQSNQNKFLPITLQEAIHGMKSTELPRELFGDAFTDHFIQSREWEWLQYSKQVSDWERKRYFEII